jgi:hypothetical protein
MPTQQEPEPFTTEDGAVKLYVIGGPHPYLWIGEVGTERCFGTTDTDTLREIRDAMTQALRNGGQHKARG